MNYGDIEIIDTENERRTFGCRENREGRDDCRCFPASDAASDAASDPASETIDLGDPFGDGGGAVSEESSSCSSPGKANWHSDLSDAGQQLGLSSIFVRLTAAGKSFG